MAEERAFGASRPGPRRTPWAIVGSLEQWRSLPGLDALGLGCAAILGGVPSLLLAETVEQAAVLGAVATVAWALAVSSFRAHLQPASAIAARPPIAVGPQGEPGHALDLVDERDPLTGLSGKVALKMATRRLLRSSAETRERVALITFDLDRLKDVNACWGYRVGDEVLRHTARRLQTLVGRDLLISRLDADRFALIVAGVDDLDQVRLLAETALARLARPLDIDGSEITMSASIGVALYPDHGGGFDQLMRCAELALDEAKREGGGRVNLFDPRMDLSLKARKAMERELRRAIENGELVLHYQPQIDIRTGEVVACEALIRWQHPTRGLVPPIEFVPLAETTGLIRPIGNWVIAEACKAARRWHDAGITVRVAVNCSPAQLRQQDLMPVLRRVLAETGLPPAALELEVTESLFVDPTQIAIRRCLDEVGALGVGLAIDDFGTGYSSLAYLKRLPVDRIKIDRSFLRGVGKEAVDDAIVRAIIGLAKTFDRRVVAEGVESEGQLAFLRAEGCEEAQGYLFSRPLPEAECTAYLHSRRALPAEEELGVDYVPRYAAAE